MQTTISIFNKYLHTYSDYHGKQQGIAKRGKIICLWFNEPEDTPTSNMKIYSRISSIRGTVLFRGLKTGKMTAIMQESSTKVLLYLVDALHINTLLKTQGHPRG